MKSIFILMTALFSVQSMADALSVSIEHPRKNKRPAFTNSVACPAQCNKSLEEDIKSLFTLADSGKIPQSPKLTSRLRYMNVQVSEGNKLHKFELGTPEIYSGNDLTKFTALNKLLIKIDYSISRTGRE